MEKKTLFNRIYTKIVYLLNLLFIFPVDGHLTNSEKRRFSLDEFNKIEGWFSEREGIALFRTASKLPKNCTVVEIGSWKGKSTYALASGVGKKGKIIAIDPFDATAIDDKASERSYQRLKGKTPVFSQFKTNMKKNRVWKRIIPNKGYSKDFVGKIPKIDLLFIDADHSVRQCDLDFLNYSPYVRIGGYIAFHDYVKRAKSSGPAKVVEKRVAHSPNYKLIGLYDSLWISRKIRYSTQNNG